MAMTNRLLVALVFTALGSIHPLAAADEVYEKGPKQSFSVSRTERVPFAPGGTIHIDNSYGYLTVEGWDEPAVELTVVKSTGRFYNPSRQQLAEQPFADVRVTAERRSDRELAISTVPPVHHRWVSLRNARRGVILEYQVHVPRDTRLIIRHDYGYVWVSDVAGDLDVHSHTGDMIVMLPDTGAYAIDARTRLGSVSSDVMGKSDSRLSQLLVGSHFDYTSQAAKRRIYLRMGRGSIEILEP